MFADPITITINAVAKVLARVQSTGTSSKYSTSDGVYTLNISHQRSVKGGVPTIRTVSRLDFKKVVTDPLTSTNDYGFLSNYSVTERPEFGFTLQEVKDQQTGFNTWHAATGAGLAQEKLFGGES